MNENELIINRIAQNLIPFEQGLDWFLDSGEQKQKSILKSLDICLYQSHPYKEEIEDGIVRSGLRATFTPCVLMKKKSFNDARHKILNLPKEEWKKSFVLLMTIFGIADKRRRETDCSDGCYHEWHNIKKLYRDRDTP